MCCCALWCPFFLFTYKQNVSLVRRHKNESNVQVHGYNGQFKPYVVWIVLIWDLAHKYYSKHEICKKQLCKFSVIGGNVFIFFKHLNFNIPTVIDFSQPRDTLLIVKFLYQKLLCLILLLIIKTYLPCIFVYLCMYVYFSPVKMYSFTEYFCMNILQKMSNKKYKNMSNWNKYIFQAYKKVVLSLYQRVKEN